LAFLPSSPGDWIRTTMGFLYSIPLTVPT
jgi:hypothetical protein